MTEFQFPEFVADQLLTAEDLNNMFGYLEEQERLTRTTMIGIGIICGLDAKTSADGTSITITRGGGDTSEGYLMRLETDTFYEYKAFDALKPKYYDVFVNSTVEASGDIKRTQKFPIWELFSKSETDAQPLSKTFLQDKVVLLFYEMLEVDAKNCDPTSCDDKGRDVLITIRKLLITKEAAEQLLPKEDKASGSGLTTEELLAEKLKLPELRIRRFDVGATNLVDTNHIYEAYQRIFSKNMVIGVDNALYQMHKLYKYLVKDVVSGNPFNNFSDKFAFLHNGSISGNNLLHFQYFYGFFYDLLQAYEELRCLGLKITAQCCPDPNLFPRHLLLGEAIPDAGQERLRYRNYFIPSPILNNQADMVAYFKVLYKRLVLMINNVQMPVPAASVKNGVDTNIRVTPSKLGCYPLADKAIPYYYKPNEENGRLYLYWGYKWHCKMKPRHVLSYNATKYNTEDDFVINPLSYDIEPYNFYRIEGHVGKNYKAALSAITATRNNARLPFDVVAVSASLNEGEIDLKKMYCHFHDLEALYDSLRAQLVCALCKLAVYYYGFATTVETLEIISNKPNLPLLKACAPDFTFQIRTLGHEFEILYPVIKNVNDINIGFYLNPNYINQILNFDNNLLRKFILFFMQKLFEQLPEDLSDFSLADFKFYHDRLVTVMKAMRVYLLGRLVQADGRAQEVILEDEIDHLDALLHVCTSRSLEALQAEYAERLTRVRGLTQLSKFVEKHPGIEHKGGVPKGGTFVLVYFEKEKQKPQANNVIFNIDSLAAPGTDTAIATPEAAMADTSSFDNILEQLKAMGLSDEMIAELKKKFFGFKPDKAGLFDAKLADYVDGTVVADFYLPYLCCSDCPPVQYFITESNVVLTLTLDDNEFCGSSEKTYPFKFSPAGGEVTGESVNVSEDEAGNKNFTFTPSAVVFADGEKQKEIVFTYKLDDQETTFRVTVYRKPLAQFDITPVPGSARQVLIENKSEYGTLYEWDFGETDDAGDTSTLEQPGVRTYKEDGSYAVTLKVTNGVCSSTASKVATIVPPGAIKIGLDKIEFCNDEKGPFIFSVSPEGTKVTGEGVDAVGDNVFAFFPPVDLGGADQKTVQFTGTAPDGRTATFDIIVYEHPPRPVFTFERVNNTNEVIFNITEAKFAKSFRWDFGDGQTQTTTEDKINHTYLQQGTYRVSLRSRNGPCTSAPAETEVSIKEVVVITKTCMPLRNIIGDFEGLKQMEGIRTFASVFEAFRMIDAFMSAARQFDTASREEQLKLFVDRKAAILLEAWLQQLRGWVFNSDFPLIAIALYRVLMNTAMLIACLKGKDISADDPDLRSVFKLIVTDVRDMVSNLADRNAMKEVMLAMKEDVNAEQQRMLNNNEDKPTYKVIIQRLVDTFQPLNA